MKREELAQRLEPQVVYGIIEVQDLIGIPFEELLLAAGDGEIARFLGEGIRMHFIGQDLIDWLSGRNAWPNQNSDARQQADTTRHRMRRQVSTVGHHWRPPRSGSSGGGAG